MNNNLKTKKTTLQKAIALIMSIVGIVTIYGCGKEETKNTTTYSSTTSVTNLVTTTEVQDNFIDYEEALEIAKNNTPANATYHDYRQGDASEFIELTAEQEAVAIVLFGNEDENKVSEELIEHYTEENNSTDPKSALDYATGFINSGGKVSVLSPNSPEIKDLVKLIESGADFSEINARISKIVEKGTAKEEVLALLVAIANMENINTEDLEAIFEEFKNATNFVLSQANEANEQNGVENTQVATTKHK